MEPCWHRCCHCAASLTTHPHITFALIQGTLVCAPLCSCVVEFCWGRRHGCIVAVVMVLPTVLSLYTPYLLVDDHLCFCFTRDVTPKKKEKRQKTDEASLSSDDATDSPIKARSKRKARVASSDSSDGDGLPLLNQQIEDDVSDKGTGSETDDEYQIAKKKTKAQKKEDAEENSDSDFFLEEESPNGKTRQSDSESSNDIPVVKKTTGQKRKVTEDSDSEFEELTKKSKADKKAAKSTKKKKRKERSYESNSEGQKGKRKTSVSKSKPEKSKSQQASKVSKKVCILMKNQQ